MHGAVASGRVIILAGKSSSSPGEGVAANLWCLSVNAMYVNTVWKRPSTMFSRSDAAHLWFESKAQCVYLGDVHHGKM